MELFQSSLWRGPQRAEKGTLTEGILVTVAYACHSVCLCCLNLPAGSGPDALPLFLWQTAVAYEKGFVNLEKLDRL